MIVHLVTALVFLAFSVNIIILLHGLKSGDSKRLFYYHLLLLCCAVLCLSETLYFFSRNVTEAVFTVRIEYAVSPFIGPLFFFFAADFFKIKFKNRLFAPISFGISAAIVIVIAIRVLDEHMWISFQFKQMLTIPFLGFTAGWLYYLVDIWNCAFALAALGLLIYNFVRKNSSTRRLLLPIIIGVVVLIIINSVYLFGLLPGGMAVFPLGCTAFLVLARNTLHKTWAYETRSDNIETAFHAMSEGVVLADAEYHLLSYNQAAARIFPMLARIGYRNSISIIPQLVNAIKNSMSAGKANTVSGFAIKCDDGVSKYYDAKVATIKTKGVTSCHTILIQDVTANTELLSSLVDSKNETEDLLFSKGRYLSNVGYCLQAPLSTITGSSKLLFSEELSSRQRAYVQEILNSATNMIEIVDSIIEYTKLDSGDYTLNPVNYNLPLLLEQIESLYTYVTKSKGLAFSLIFKGEIPQYLYGDDVRLRQLLNNLLRNAVQFTHKGRVTLTVEVVNEVLKFTVKDTGIGITEDDVARLFTPKGIASMSSNSGSAGLGLTITKSIIKMMNGSIDVSSVYGKGSVFTIKLPIIYGESQNLTPGHTDFTYIKAPAANVLVVDDNSVNLKVASKLLKLSEISADTASSAEECFKRLETKKYDLIFMDHMMPEMDGIEAVRIIRKTYSEEELVIVALSANAVESARDMFLEAGMQDFLAKPVDKSKLQEILLRWLPSSIIGKM